MSTGERRAAMEMRNAELERVTSRSRPVRFTWWARADAGIPVARKRGEQLPAEELRLRHRHLDLRRPELRDNIVLRHRLMQATRGFLSDDGFVEIETPILTKPTPEGARDYLVPSRVHPGEFYALPQSPQLYKQLLMVAGLRSLLPDRAMLSRRRSSRRPPARVHADRHRDIVRHARRHHRGRGRMVTRALGSRWTHHPPPFRRMTYADAMERYGCDRPDLRYGLEINDVTAVFAASDSSSAGDRCRRTRPRHSCPGRGRRCRASRWTSSR